MRLNWCAGVVGLVVVFGASRHAASTASPVRFADIQEFKAFADGLGLYHHTGTRFSSVSNNCYVADHAITFDDLTSVATRRDCGLTPSWAGVLWVNQIPAQPSGDYVFPEPGGKWRLWGNVLVAGDEALMDRMRLAS
jgi:hypothetical protein